MTDLELPQEKGSALERAKSLVSMLLGIAPPLVEQLWTGQTGVVGGTAGAMLGFAGPIAFDMARRQLSPDEFRRIGTALQTALDVYESNVKMGRELRADWPYAASEKRRDWQHDLLEGVLLSAQREHEEKKAKLYGRLLGNAPFRKGIEPAVSLQLLRIATSISYRQLCLLSVIHRLQDLGITAQQPEEWTDDRVSLHHDAFDLIGKGLTTNGGTARDYATAKPTRSSLTSLGRMLYELMDLGTVDGADAERVAAGLRVTRSAPFG